MGAYEWTWGITRYPGNDNRPELGNFYDPAAVPRCSNCEDFGEVGGQPCPGCSGEVKAEALKRKPKP